MEDYVHDKGAEITLKKRMSLVRLLDTPEGNDVISFILNECCVLGCAVTNDPIYMARCEGMRYIAIRFLDDMEAAEKGSSARAIAVMQQTAQKEKDSIAAVVENFNEESEWVL